MASGVEVLQQHEAWASCLREGAAPTLSPAVHPGGLSTGFAAVMDSCFSFSCLLSQLITVGGGKKEVKQKKNAKRWLFCSHGNGCQFNSTRRPGLGAEQPATPQSSTDSVGSNHPEAGGRDGGAVSPFSFVFSTSLLSFSFCTVVSSCSFSFRTCKTSETYQDLLQKNKNHI